MIWDCVRSSSNCWKRRRRHTTRCFRISRTKRCTRSCWRFASVPFRLESQGDFHFVRLRGAAKGHAAYRHVAEKLWREVITVHPWLGELLFPLGPDFRL